jgi:serine/threonine protein kinase
LLEFNRNSFNFIQVIGKTSIGKIWKVQCKKYKDIYALEEISKSTVKDKNSFSHVNLEREILSKINHPFIIHLQFSFQDEENFYLVTDYIAGGDLRSNYEKFKKFSEPQLSKIIFLNIFSQFF